MVGGGIIRERAPYSLHTVCILQIPRHSLLADVKYNHRPLNIKHVPEYIKSLVAVCIYIIYRGVGRFI